MALQYINVTNRVATHLKKGGSVVCGNKDYVIEFIFDSEWDGYEKKTARFIWNNKHKDVKFTGNICPMPDVHRTDVVKVGVYAGDLCTTTPASIPCLRSILCGSNAPHEGNEEYYASEAQIAAEAAQVSAETAQVSAETAQEAAQEAARCVSGAQKRYELIETITLAEETTWVERTQEPNGTNYNFKDLLIVVTSIDGTKAVLGKWLKWNVYCGNDTKPFGIFRSVGIGYVSGNNRTVLKSETDGNFKRLNMTGSSTNTQNADASNTVHTAIDFKLTDESITRFSLQHETGMPIGTVIEIYGVRV